MDVLRADTAEVSSRRKGIFADVKNDVIAASGEFVGTILFLLFALGAAQTVSQNVEGTAQEGAASVTNPTGDLTLRIISWFYISSAFGLSLFAFASVFYRFTGSIFNPSIGLALMLAGVLGPVRFVLTAFAQMLGGIVAAAILDALTPGGLGVQARLSPGTSTARGLFIEMFATAGLTLSVLMLAAEKHNLTPMAPLGVGLTLWVVMLWSIGFTGGSVNTARAFGPDVVSRSFASYHWIYWLGPTLGALLAAGFYLSLKYIGYWRVNPGQDSTDVRNSAMPDLHLTTSPSAAGMGPDSGRVRSDSSRSRGGGGARSPQTRMSDLTMVDAGKGRATMVGGGGGAGAGETYPKVEHNPNGNGYDGMRARQPLGNAIV